MRLFRQHLRSKSEFIGRMNILSLLVSDGLEWSKWRIFQTNQRIKKIRKCDSHGEPFLTPLQF